jgi:hypothetical protein
MWIYFVMFAGFVWPKEKALHWSDQITFETCIVRFVWEQKLVEVIVAEIYVLEIG